ncbi:hypothetical protein ACYSUO_22185 [Streptomyces sp. UC4497]
MPELQKATRTQEPAWAGRITAAVIAVVALLMAAMFFAQGVEQSGATGSTGTLTVTDCYPRGSQGNTCVGRFRSDSGQEAVDDAVAKPRYAYASGEKVTVSGSGGSYTVQNWSESAWTFCLAFFYLGAFSFVLRGLPNGFKRMKETTESSPDKWYSITAPIRDALSVWCFLVSLVGLIASIVVYST